MEPNWKVKTQRCAAYLKFIRSKPCIICGTTYNVQAHHSEGGGMALTGNDFSAVPLCGGLEGCHCMVHQKHSKSGYWKPDDLSAIIKRLQAEYGVK